MASIFDQAGSLLASVAPSIAAAFGGPLAGQAVQYIESALGIAPTAEQTMDQRQAQAAQAIISATPDQLLALKKADQDFAAKMKELDVDLEKIAAADRANARQMQVETHDWTPRALALGLTVGFFAILGWMVVNGTPAQGHDALLVLLGSLGTAWTAVVGYYFGSSAGSAKKDQTISALSR